MRTVLLQHSQAMAMARAEVMARPTRRSAEVRAREASAEREAARLRASGMALIGKGRGFGGAGVFESAKAARKFRLPLLPRDPRRPRPTKKWKSLPGTFVRLEKLKPWGGAKFSGQVEWEYAIKDSKEQVEWEPVVLGYFWKNGRVKFGYVMIEKEKIEKFGYVNRPRAIDTRGGGGAVDGVFTTDKRQQPAVAGVQRITKTATHP